MSRKAKALAFLASKAGRKAVGALTAVILGVAGLGHIAAPVSQVAGETVGEIAEQATGGKPADCECQCPDAQVNAG